MMFGLFFLLATVPATMATRSTDTTNLVIITSPTTNVESFLVYNFDEPMELARLEAAVMVEENV